MEGVKIRDMEYSDLPGVQTVSNKSFSIPWGINSFKNEINNRGAILKVAVLNGRIIGYACIRVMLDITHIIDIAVLPGHRQKGIAGGLFQNILKDLMQLKPDTKQVTLEVRDSNSAAIGLYKKFGFNERGRRKNYYKNPCEDAIIMSLDVAIKQY